MFDLRLCFPDLHERVAESHKEKKYSYQITGVLHLLKDPSLSCCLKQQGRIIESFIVNLGASWRRKSQRIRCFALTPFFTRRRRVQLWLLLLLQWGENEEVQRKRGAELKFLLYDAAVWAFDCHLTFHSGEVHQDMTLISVWLKFTLMTQKWSTNIIQTYTMEMSIQTSSLVKTLLLCVVS